MRLVWGLCYPVRSAWLLILKAEPARQLVEKLTLAGLGVFSGRFCAESKTVLGKAQAPRVEASQGFYCPGFIQPNKQTNKHDLLGGFTSLPEREAE